VAGAEPSIPSGGRAGVRGMRGDSADARNADPTMDVRVILVGRTGLDSTLRTDPGVDLTRVKTPVDAIGELASPPDDLSPRDAVVVVGQDATPGRAAHTPETPEQFVAGLRLIDPAVRVVSCGERVAGFDGVVDPSDAAAASYLRSMFEPQAGAMAAPMQNRQAEEAGPQVVVTAAAKQSRSGPVVADAADETSIAKAVLRGGSPLDAAVTKWRNALNEPGLNFVPGTSGEGFAVMWDGQRVGTITGATRPSPLLQFAADDLAAWLRVGEQMAQLRAAAFTDALTGAWNRRYFELFTESAMKVAREARRAVTILLFDIDNFKTYNDRYGHEAGDEILREVVSMLRSVIRPTDRVCRIGGDEFVVIFNEPDGPREATSRHPRHVEAIAERFQAAVRAHRFPKLGQEARGTLTVSGGLATFPWDGHTVADLLRVADERELCSKKHGKNAITLGPGASE
jgi:two-component system cell cycle response regulator